MKHAFITSWIIVQSKDAINFVKITGINYFQFFTKIIYFTIIVIKTNVNLLNNKKSTSHFSLIKHITKT